MTLTQINYFLTVVETGSFSAAADRLFVSQPAVSKQIAAFEKELGFTLLDRSSHEHFLTPSGQLLYETLSRCANDISQTISTIRRSTSDSSVFRIGCYENWEVKIILDLLTQFFAEKCPGITPQIEAYVVTDLIAALTNREIDAAMATESLFDGSHSLLTWPAGSMRLGILYSIAHYRPESADFFSAPLLVSDQLPIHEQQICLRHARNSGYLGSVIRFRTNATVNIQVLRGRGLAIISQFDIMKRDPNFGFLPFPEALPLSIACLRRNVSSQTSRICNDIGQAVLAFDAVSRQL